MSQWLKSLLRISSSNTAHFVPSNYDKLTRPQLIAKIKALEDQLSTNTHPIRHGKSRPFDMTQYSQQRIALKVAYLGWNYSGFAAQGDEGKTPTVEGQLFKALQSCKLITHPDQCNFTRCGRTDKGVSGLGQVIALNVRSSHNKHASTTPLPYIEILNRLLPDDIRILAWAPVNPSFNARFDCKSRTYKYFFQKGTLDLELMREAARFMMGSHDFRNFCRLDPSKNITNYERTVVSLNIKPAVGSNDFYQVELKGTAFLWHQVRCIMAVLFLVGQKLEKPEIVRELLDINTFPARPEYPMASDLPLLLYDCEFEDIQWIYANQDDQKDVKIPTPVRTWRHFNEFRSAHVIKSLLYKTCIDEIEAMPMFKDFPEYEQSTVLLGAGKSIRTSRYRPLKDRPQADSDQVKKDKYRIKQLKKAEIKWGRVYWCVKNGILKAFGFCLFASSGVAVVESCRVKGNVGGSGGGGGVCVSVLIYGLAAGFFRLPCGVGVSAVLLLALLLLFFFRLSQKLLINTWAPQNSEQTFNGSKCSVAASSFL